MVWELDGPMPILKISKRLVFMDVCLPNYDATPASRLVKASPAKPVLSCSSPVMQKGLLVLQKRIEVRKHFGRIPLLGADEFAGDPAAAVNDISFGD